MKAVILLSGGLDSTVILAQAIKEKKECYALSFDYNQKHRIELNAAKRIASHYGINHQIIKIEPEHFNRSALVSGEAVPKSRSIEEIQSKEIPKTYVPARNTLFLAYALGHAEMLSAKEIHIGINALDSNPYPDCTPQFLSAFQLLANVATKQSVEGDAPRMIAPLLMMNKREIWQLGLSLGAPVEWTFSCYDPQKENPCGCCDACLLRKQGRM